MSLEQFLALINKVGEDKILAIMFNNSSRHYFIDEKLNMEKHLDKETECLKFTEFDTWGNPYQTFKPLGTIEAVLQAHNSINQWSSYEIRSIG